jgi:3D-(3,5/4)-trihydroxycyclohexane-1,2-dione acylhydrolase (decyclizing)
VIAIGTRLQDFTTGSGLLLGRPGSGVDVLSINVARHDLVKRSGMQVQGDARRCLEELGALLPEYRVKDAWSQKSEQLRRQWNDAVAEAVTRSQGDLPSDAEVLGVVNKAFSDNATVVCAAGGLPGELHKLWRANDDDSYHLEYGFSCMGYEIAGGLGVKMALPQRDVVVMVGDGSYLMLNSEIATSVALEQKLIIVVLDNRGFGCINRLQTSLGGKAYNNLWDSSYGRAPDIDFAAHAAALGALSEKVANLEQLDQALQRAREADRTYVVVIDTDPVASTAAGGAWWDVPVADVSRHEDVRQASKTYRDHTRKR